MELLLSRNLPKPELSSLQPSLSKNQQLLKPNQFLRFTACRDALALGAHRLNLGSTPPGARGLAYYKARWGGTRVHYASWIRWHGLGRLARALAVSGSPGAAPVAVREPGVAPATAR